MKRYFLSSTLLACSLLTACNNSTSTDNNTKTDTQTHAPSAKQVITPSGHDEQVAKALQANLDHAKVDLKVSSVIATEMPNVYLASFQDAPVMFTDAKGEYLIQGQIAKISGQTPVDIGAKAQSSVAKQLLSQVDNKQMIIFEATGTPKASIYVFSDPTCHYCQKLHSEIKQINDLGIEVRYLAWPRSSRYQALTESIWCSDDPKKALTDAKLGKDIAPKTCDNPVASHMALGHQIGVSGTPAIFTESGLQIGGYLPAKELSEQAIAHK